MKMIIAVLFAIGAHAALPPLAQSAREIQAILTDPKTYQILGSAEQIQEVRKTDTGYLVVTKNYQLQVDVRYGGGDRIAGPVHFELEHLPLRNCVSQDGKEAHHAGGQSLDGNRG